MAKVTIKNFERVTRTVKSKLTKVIKSSGVLERIAKKTIREIQSGKNIADRRKKLAPLADSTIERRKRLATKNPTDSKYRASKSNLTFTGQLVRSIKAKIIQSKNLIVIEPTGSRKAYTGIKGKKLKMDVKTNKELARKHSQGKGNLPKRNILEISEKKSKEVLKELHKAYKKEFK